MIFRTYNDNDPNACAWLRELIAMRELPDGFIDECSVADLRPRDIGDHAHFFAGIGGWPYALELAGWPDSRSVWTASLPCQPFSDAGKRRGTEDKRHLWPVFYDLVRERRPPVILGEQVASKAGRAWLSAVQADLEALGYRTGAADLCAASIGAPHIRQRLFWCAIRLADPGGAGLAQRQEQSARDQCASTERGGAAGGLGNPGSPGSGRNPGAIPGAQGGPAVREQSDELEPASAGGWSNVVWIPCADNKIRPLKPGLIPLVDGLPPNLVRGGDQRLAPQRTAEARTMRLRGFGNAIVPPLAALFVRTVMEFLDEKMP